MIGIVIDDNLIGIPEPIGNIGIIERGHREVKAVEPEVIAVATFNAPRVARTETAGKPAMFERTIQMEPAIVTTEIMPHPTSVRVNVRPFRMARHIAESVLFMTAKMFGTVGRNESAAYTASFFVSPLFASPILPVSGTRIGEQQCH